jgi:hypothetical protein
MSDQSAPPTRLQSVYAEAPPEIDVAWPPLELDAYVWAYLVQRESACRWRQLDQDGRP